MTKKCVKEAKIMEKPSKHSVFTNIFRWCITLFAVLVCVPILVYFSILRDLSSGEVVARKLAECQVSLQTMESKECRPAFKMSQGRQNSSILIAIPTVKRENQSYLLETLENLLANMNEKEKSVVTIVVFIADIDVKYVLEIAQKIQLKFSKYCDSGLIEIISPPASYYPDMNKLRITLDDTMDRVKWRSKQNLDYAFLMTYAAEKSVFYLQLEDDIVTQPGFVSAIRQFIDDSSGKDWFFLEFCKLGFIGKLFRSSDLPNLALFFTIFFNDKPVDWLLPEFMTTRYCHFDYSREKCLETKNLKSPLRNQSLFQHVGQFSSLKGKVQLMKDKTFLEAENLTENDLFLNLRRNYNKRKQTVNYLT